MRVSLGPPSVRYASPPSPPRPSVAGLCCAEGAWCLCAPSCAATAPVIDAPAIVAAPIPTQTLRFILAISGILSAADMDNVRAGLANATFVDGKTTAGWSARLVKSNLQADDSAH